jgi:hypothetical protein
MLKNMRDSVGEGKEEKQSSVYAYIYDVLPKMEAQKLYHEVSRKIDYDVVAAMSICLHILEDVNMHEAFKEVEPIFERVAKSFD